MNKKCEVVHAFKLPISSEDIENINKTHNYISDKIILDVVNGINVVARDLNEVSKSRSTFSSRAIDSLTGNSVKRQNLINENLIEGITACTSWLRDHDKHISRIDERICDVAYELDRTQDEILKFYNQHVNLKIDLDEFKNCFHEFKESSNYRLELIEEQIRNIDIRDRAYNLVNREISALKNNTKYQNLDLPIKIYALIDNIKSGEGGVYYLTEKNINEKAEYKQYLKNELANCIRNQLGNDSLNEFINYKNMINSNNSLEQLQRNAISFISTQHYNILSSERKLNQIADLISITTSHDPDIAYSKIEENINICNFISYKEFIEDATREHLLV